MQDIEYELFGTFPRFVGNPNQWCVFDEGSFDLFKQYNEGDSHCYSRISWYGADGSIMLDKVFLDLDGDVPLANYTETELVNKLQNDQMFREDVLGDVVNDAREVAKLCDEESIPLIGVYTGKGVHLHALFETRREPTEAFESRQQWFVEECDLDTFDTQVKGDIKRLCRVPNCRRYDDQLECPTDLYTVPLSKNELRTITADELVNFSTRPRQIPIPGESRPPFLKVPEYDVDGSHPTYEVEQKATGQLSEVSEKMEEWLKDVLQIPCMYKRLQTRNPAHYVRLNSAIMMFNVGMGVDEVVTVFSQLGWHDFDQKITRKHLKQIKRRGYVDMSCAKIQSKGLCVFNQEERESDCDHYGYNGGNSEY